MPFRRRASDRFDFRRTVLPRSTPYMRRETAMAAAAATRAATIAAMRAPAYLNRARRGLMLARGEWKSIDVADSRATDTTGGLQLLNGCARGDDIAERTGRQIMIRSIDILGWYSVTAATGTDQVQRFLVVYDKQTNAAAMTIAQLFGAPAAAMLPVTHPILENRTRFVVLYDSGPVVLNATAEAGSRVPFHWYKAINLPVTFNAGDAGTVADIVTGSIYAVCVGSNVAGVTAGAINYESRIRYEDK